MAIFVSANSGQKSRGLAKVCANIEIRWNGWNSRMWRICTAKATLAMDDIEIGYLFCFRVLNEKELGARTQTSKRTCTLYDWYDSTMSYSESRFSNIAKKTAKHEYMHIVVLKHILSLSSLFCTHFQRELYIFGGFCVCVCVLSFCHCCEFLPEHVCQQKQYLCFIRAMIWVFLGLDNSVQDELSMAFSYGQFKELEMT